MDLIEPSLKKTNNIIEILLNINEKYYLFLKNRNISDLENFINGYTYAQYVNDFKIDGLDTYNDFFDWIRKKYDYNGIEGLFYLFNKIFENSSCEERFTVFYDLLDTFLSSIDYK